MRRHQQERRRRDDVLEGVTDIGEGEDGDHSFVLYGRSATGKTTLAGSFPKPLLYLDIRDRGGRSIMDVKGIKQKQIREYAEFEETSEWLKRNPTKYQSVIVDTVSQLQELVLKERGGEKNKEHRRSGDWGSMTRREWGDVSALMKDAIINLRDLQDEGMNIVFVAQDRVFNFDEEEDQGTDDMLMPEVGPYLIPSVAKVLNASVTVIGNTFIRERTVKREVKGKVRERKEVQYCLRIGPNPVYTTKVRKPRKFIPPSVIVDPSYEDILAIMQGEE